MLDRVGGAKLPSPEGFLDDPSPPTLLLGECLWVFKVEDVAGLSEVTSGLGAIDIQLTHRSLVLLDAFGHGAAGFAHVAPRARATA